MSKNLIKDPQVGGKCYYDFKLCTIKEVANGMIHAVSDGHFTTSGNLHLWCRPVSKKTDTISKMVQGDKDKIYEHPTSPTNGPDFHRKMTDFWIRMVDGESSAKYKTFVKLLKKKMDEINQYELSGFQPFTRR